MYHAPNVLPVGLAGDVYNRPWYWVFDRGRQKGWGEELYGEGGQHRSLAWIQVLWQAASVLSIGMSTNKTTCIKKLSRIKKNNNNLKRNLFALSL